MLNSYPKVLKFLDITCILLLLGAIGVVGFYAPLEAVMGMVQKVFYFHVASLWVGMLGFLTAAIASGFYLYSNRDTWDMISLASIEISLVFFFAGIISGSIWARPVWNTWWTWDPRLTSAVIVELIYAAYFLLRQAIQSSEKRARFSAVYSLVGFLSVPLTFFSIRMLRTIHPVVMGNDSTAAQALFDLTPAMLHTLVFSIFVFSILFLTLLWHRVLLERLTTHIEKLHPTFIED